MDLNIDKDCLDAIRGTSAILGITIMMCYALYKGHDGVLLISSIGIVSGLGLGKLVSGILRK